MRAHPYDRYPLLGDDVAGALHTTKVFRHLLELERGGATLVDIAGERKDPGNVDR